MIGSFHHLLIPLVILATKRKDYLNIYLCILLYLSKILLSRKLCRGVRKLYRWVVGSRNISVENYYLLQKRRINTDKKIRNNL